MWHRIYQLCSTADKPGSGSVGCAAQLVDSMSHFLGFNRCKLTLWMFISLALKFNLISPKATVAFQLMKNDFFRKENKYSSLLKNYFTFAKQTVKGCILSHRKNIFFCTISLSTRQMDKILGYKFLKNANSNNYF